MPLANGESRFQLTTLLRILRKDTISGNQSETLRKKTWLGNIAFVISLQLKSGIKQSGPNAICEKNKKYLVLS